MGKAVKHARSGRVHSKRSVLESLCVCVCSFRQFQDIMPLLIHGPTRGRLRRHKVTHASPDRLVCGEGGDLCLLWMTNETLKALTWSHLYWISVHTIWEFASIRRESAAAIILEKMIRSLLLLAVPFALCPAKIKAYWLQSVMGFPWFWQGGFEVNEKKRGI